MIRCSKWSIFRCFKWSLNRFRKPWCKTKSGQQVPGKVAETKPGEVHLTHGKPAEVFPALGFPARFRKNYKNKSCGCWGYHRNLLFKSQGMMKKIASHSGLERKKHMLIFVRISKGMLRTVFMCFCSMFFFWWLHWWRMFKKIDFILVTSLFIGLFWCFWRWPKIVGLTNDTWSQKILLLISDWNDVKVDRRLHALKSGAKGCFAQLEPCVHFNRCFITF